VKANVTRVHVSDRPDKQGRLKVSGLLSVKGHALPFRHSAHVDDDPAELEKRLDEHHEKAVVWAALREHHKKWTNEKEEHGGGKIHVRFSDIGAFGPNDWRLTVIWDEEIGGQMTHHTKVYQADHPAGLPKPEAVKEHVRGQLATRVAHHQSAKAHHQIVGAMKHEISRKRAQAEKQHGEGAKKERA